MTQNKNIFLVEDDLSFGAVLRSYLEINDFDVTWVDDGKYAIERFKNGSFDICILDVMLPNVDGFTIGTEIRKLNNNIPFIFLTAKAMKDDVIKGFDIGADDYITKPFDTEVLIYKIKAILNRGNRDQSPKNTNEYKIGNYSFHVQKRNVTINGKDQKLSPKRLHCLNSFAYTKMSFYPEKQPLIKYGEMMDILRPEAWMFLSQNFGSICRKILKLRSKTFTEADLFYTLKNKISSFNF